MELIRPLAVHKRMEVYIIPSASSRGGSKEKGAWPFTDDAGMQACIKGSNLRTRHDQGRQACHGVRSVIRVSQPSTSSGKA